VTNFLPLAVRTLEEAASAGKWHYVLYVAAHALVDSPSEENIRHFMAAIGELRGSRQSGAVRLAAALLVRYFTAAICRNRTGKLRCIVAWLCLFPGSHRALRSLAMLAKKTPGMDQVFLASMQLIPLEKIRRDERTKLCRTLLANGNGAEAAAVAQKILELNPESAEARHLLWSALLQSGKTEEKLFTIGCE
jgi:hypothetical protein